MLVLLFCFVKDPNSRFRGEAPLSLEGATASIAVDYTKRQHVFRLKLSNGADYLLNAKDAVSGRRLSAEVRCCCIE